MKILFTALLLIVIIITAVACAESAGETQQSDTAVVTKAETTDDGKVSDDLPEADFEGRIFTAAAFENANINNMIIVEAQDGEVFNDSLYNREHNVEDRFNIDIQQYVFGDGSGWVRKTVLAGDDAFQIASVRCTEALAYWQEDLLIPMNEVPLIDLTKPYWDTSVNKSLTLGGVQYVAMGSFNISTYDLTFSLLFNKDMITDYNFDNPYTVVESGSWTFDKMNEMMTAVISDVDGDGKWTESDRYGYLAHNKMVLPDFWISAGEMVIAKDEADIPYLSMSGERFNAVFNKIFEITRDNNAWYKGKFDFDIPTVCIDMFSADKSLFMDMSFFYMQSMRNTEVEFGIIPYPKYDDKQDRYYSRVSYYIPTMVPVTCTDREFAGCILEALMCESENTVVPAYYEIALKTKYSRDDESAAMLDFIFSTRVVDIGDTTLCDKIRDGYMAQMFEADNRNLASKVASTEKIITGFIEKLPVGKE